MQDQILTPDQQEQQLPQLAELLKNPWWKHFQQLWLNERTKAGTIVFDIPTAELSLGKILPREQIIGEGRAYKQCATKPQQVYDELVKQIQSKNPPNERTTTTN